MLIQSSLEVPPTLNLEMSYSDIALLLLQQPEFLVLVATLAALTWSWHKFVFVPWRNAHACTT